MVLAPRLQQRVSQYLILTPQPRQAIEIFQLNNIKSRAFIDQELERNPLLEMETSLNRVPPDTPISQTEPHFKTLKHHHLKVDDASHLRDSEKLKSPMRQLTLYSPPTTIMARNTM